MFINICHSDYPVIVALISAVAIMFFIVAEIFVSPRR